MTGDAKYRQVVEYREVPEGDPFLGIYYRKVPVLAVPRFSLTGRAVYTEEARNAGIPDPRIVVEKTAVVRKDRPAAEISASTDYNPIGLGC